MSGLESVAEVRAPAPVIPALGGAVPTSVDARAKCCIAALEEELDTLRQEKGTKQRKTTYYVAQGRAIRHMVALYTSLEDLIAKNDCRCEDEDDSEDNTLTQDRLQRGYIALMQALPWLHDKLTHLDIDDAEDMLKKLKRGTDAAQGDDTSTLKDLVASWVNQDFRPSHLLKSDDKHSRGFVHDICGKLLCPAEWDWNSDSVKAGIHDRTVDYIVSENSWPLFVYEDYSINPDNLEQGLFKSKVLVQAFKATFTSPSSAREADGDSDRADILENNRRARRQLNQAKIKISWQVHFALSSVTSWHTVDGDFDYEIFWNNIVDFFEAVPGPGAQCRVNKLLEWWTRKVFGRNHCEDLTPDIVSKMSVTALADQRMALEDATFDSD
ncbi:uncharacterized protein BJ212DRAFT_1298528 [Suillus subaureus]|uniref:Uncharacterized protein n=1 Tax=Suillus subaureus TaxID=48587 RepID=A0A9P7EFK8_9AGAM|nr:uncharacterized protein BJ212DRAFT_1298528 [Suillus subaureus]KAG1819313.1 hypothetical protein BJ212DRAFT_1298528 [Suillus subaureus]